MWMFNRAKRPATLLWELYSRYLFVIVLLIVLVGLAQFQSIYDGLYTTEANSLNFAISDVWSVPYVVQEVEAGKFTELSPRLMNLLAIRGINVRILDARRHVLGEQYSKYDPTKLVPFVSRQVFAAKAKISTEPMLLHLKLYTEQVKNQVVLFAQVGVPHPQGYIELGYDQSLFSSVLYQQALNFLVISIIVILLAVALLIPVVRMPLLPLHQLINTATRIKQGEFQERLPVLGPRETVRLAEVINDTLDELAKAMQREKAATVRMKQFVSDASHELRTPLTAVRGFTDVLLRRIESYYRTYALLPEGGEDEYDIEDEMQGILLPIEQFEDTRQALIAMQRETARLEGLVKDLLQLARLDGGLKPQLALTDLAELIRELRPQFDMIAEGRAIIYDLQPAMAQIDGSMVKQIIYNLVANAIEHTDRQLGEITISSLSHADGKVRLIVKDNGTGIPENQLAKIFDRFYRASEARERVPGGAGLGLSIVSEIVRLHHGEIHVFSELGKGTEMRVDL